MSLLTPHNGEKLICSVCNKEFKASDNTRFIINNGWTCSWACFINEHKKQMQEKWKKQKEEKHLVETGKRKQKGRKRTTADEKVNSAYNRIKAEAIKNHNSREKIPSANNDSEE